MSEKAKVTEAQIRAEAGGEDFRRGQEYYRQGAVASLALRGNQLLAEVEGSEYEPYRITVTFDSGGIKDYDCSCPRGGFCKHLVAALLAYATDPWAAVERPTLDSLLADLKADQLRAVLVGLTAHNAELIDQIEGQVLALRSQKGATAAKKQRKTQIDVSAYRRQVKSALRSLDHMSGSEAYWQVGGVAREVVAVAEQARPFIENGDAASALAILQAVTEEYLAGWEILDDSDGDASDAFERLGEIWTDALLSTELSAEERKGWDRKLKGWEKNVADYGIDEAFTLARQAAQEGWDDPELLAILRGEKVTREYSPSDDWYGADLTDYRLAALERQGRNEEYLNLARAEGKLTSYLTMLVKMGRTAEAVAMGLRQMTTTTEALRLAQSLRDSGAVDEALRIGEHGLTLAGQRAELARWLRDLALGANRPELTLKAAQAAMSSGGSLEDYVLLKTAAGESWPELREQTIEQLRKAGTDARGKVEIFLQEGLIDDAIGAVGQVYSYDMLARVVEAAAPERPDWAIKTAVKQAEEIMDGAKSAHYLAAAQWLVRAASAYRHAGRADDWRAYLDGLLKLHARKYKLVPLLQDLKRY